MLKAIIILMASVGAAGASAAPITYSVNQMIGIGSVVGTIETDGTIGTLAQSNVLAFNFAVSGPGASITLTDANSVVVNEGANLSADSNNIYFNYSGNSGFILFQQGSFGTGQRYYCNASVAATCFQGASAIPESFNSPSAQVEPRVGTQIIGTVASLVPEAQSWAMMIAGFGAIGGSMRSRRKAVIRFDRHRC